MIIRRKELEQLSIDIRRIIDGQAVDMRDNLEGRLSILKNDIHTLAGRLNEQADNLQKEKLALADTLADISHQLKTPLTAMMVMVELLDDAPPEKATEFITNLKAGVGANKLACKLPAKNGKVGFWKRLIHANKYKRKQSSESGIAAPANSTGYKKPTSKAFRGSCFRM